MILGSEEKQEVSGRVKKIGETVILIQVVASDWGGGKESDLNGLPWPFCFSEIRVVEYSKQDFT